MLKFLAKLSVFVFLLTNVNLAKADSFVLSNTTENYVLVYIEDLEFYNHRKTPAYSKRIAEKLAFNSSVLVTESQSLADYYLTPKLEMSKFDAIDEGHGKYSMLVSFALRNKAGEIVAEKKQSRYIIIEDIDDMQNIAKRLLVKLLEDGTDDISLEISKLVS